MKIILPKYDVDALLKRCEGIPLFYLIGPVLGGGDWQTEMSRLLDEKVGDSFIVNPCRWGDNHPLYENHAGEVGPYAHQLEWEQKFIEIALTRKRSCVIAWLACESDTLPRQDGNPYARDSYGELGYLRGLLKYDRSLPFVLGGETQFPGLSVILRNFVYTSKNAFPFYETMDATATAAAKMVMK